MRTKYGRWLFAATILGVVLVAHGAAAAPITYSEAISGDLPTFPTTALLLDIGSNTVAGHYSHIFATPTTQGVVDFDSFGFSVPTGAVVTSIRFAATAASMSPFQTHFTGFALDDSLPETVPHLSTEGVFFTTAAPTADVSLFAAFVPLGPGLFSIYNGTLGNPGEADYVWTLTVESSAVPEPASLLLLGVGAAALAATARRRQHHVTPHPHDA